MSQTVAKHEEASRKVLGKRRVEGGIGRRDTVEVSVLLTPSRYVGAERYGYLVRASEESSRAQRPVAKETADMVPVSRCNGGVHVLPCQA